MSRNQHIVTKRERERRKKRKAEEKRAKKDEARQAAKEGEVATEETGLDTSCTPTDGTDSAPAGDVNPSTDADVKP